MRRSARTPIKTGDLVTVMGLPAIGTGIVIRLIMRDLSYDSDGGEGVRVLFADVRLASGNRAETMVDNLTRVDDVLGDM